jgi:hypothetical protein
MERSGFDPAQHETSTDLFAMVGEVLRGPVKTGSRAGEGTHPDGDDRVGRVVRHANGRTGWILWTNDQPRGSTPPSFRVMTSEGQQTWWHQHRCSFVET